MKTLMAVVVAALACAAVADAPKGAPEGGRPRGMMAPGEGMMMVDPMLRLATSPMAAEKLGLSEEQIAKAKELSQGGRDANKANQQKLREAMSRQMELMKAEKVDEAAVMASIDEVFELRKAMAKDQTRRVIAVKALLTPEQIKKATEEMKTMRATRGPGREGRRFGDRQREGRGPAKGEGAPKAAPADKGAPSAE